MPDNSYKLMNKRELLQLVKKGPYTFDIDEGVICNKHGKQLKAYTNEEGHMFVRVYWKGKRKACAVHRLIWMAATGCTIPKKFEIHHRDTDVAHNSFENLMCVHELDHRKFHAEHYEDDDIPF